MWELFTLGQEPYGDLPTPAHIIQVKRVSVIMMMTMKMEDGGVGVDEVVGNDDDDDDDDDLIV